MTDRALRAASRRLRFRSRSVAVSVALILAVLAVGAVGTESVVAALGLPALLISPADVAALAGGGTPVAYGGGAALAALGLVAVVLALAPGRRARHELADDRTVIVIDDDVLASGLSRATASAAAVAPDHVRTGVSRRRAVSRVRPATGFPPDRDAAAGAARAVVERIAPRPAVRTDVRIDTEGVLA